MMKHRKRKLPIPIVLGTNKVIKPSLIKMKEPNSDGSVIGHQGNDLTSVSTASPSKANKNKQKMINSLAKESSQSNSCMKTSSIIHSESIELVYLDRKEDATMVRKSVDITSEELKQVRKRNKSGLQLLELPTQCSHKKSALLLRWILWPLPFEEFLTHYNDQRSFLIKRKMSDYWLHWLSLDQFHQLVENLCKLNKESSSSPFIHVELYREGQCFDITPPRSSSSSDMVSSTAEIQHKNYNNMIWELFNRLQCTIRVTDLQAHLACFSSLLTTLEEQFLSTFSIYAQYTHHDSIIQLPRWLDVDRFIWQLEGQVQIKIYGISQEDELLPNFSSSILTHEQLGQALMESILEPGDLLYLPRGTIYEANHLYPTTSLGQDQAPSVHSLQLVIMGLHHRPTWSDILTISLQQVVQQANKDMVECREALPRDYANAIGIMHSDSTEHSLLRKTIITQATALCQQIFKKYLVEKIDDAADSLMCHFLSYRQPPQALLSQIERGITPSTGSGHELDLISQSEGATMKLNDPSKSSQIREDEVEDSQLDDEEPITIDTKFRLVSKHCLRLVIERFASVYYATENELIPLEDNIQGRKLEMPLEYAEAVEYLCKQYPQYVAVKDLPLEDEEQQIELATELLNRKVAMVE